MMLKGGCRWRSKVQSEKKCSEGILGRNYGGRNEIVYEVSRTVSRESSHNGPRQSIYNYYTMSIMHLCQVKIAIQYITNLQQ